MSEHTAGPWVPEPMFDTDENDPPEIQGAVLITTGHERLYVAETRQQYANLISAAPDLLEALENLLDASEKYIFSTECQIQRESARAAIAKARGKE